ncbi:hypothetical protein [Tenacibaculum sp.]|uniref:hypothetical protein n=2 Tax=Tenacibaculum sp. TaxID=1906242 RepID=UPI003D14B438
MSYDKYHVSYIDIFINLLKIKYHYFMPIKSYLAHPHDGKKEELIQALSNLNHCDVIPAENKDVLVLITETETNAEEDILKQKLETISSLKLLAMVSGFNTPKKN